MLACQGAYYPPCYTAFQLQVSFTILLQQLLVLQHWFSKAKASTDNDSESHNAITDVINNYNTDGNNNGTSLNDVDVDDDGHNNDNENKCEQCS